jgi:hypothetical protein
VWWTGDWDADGDFTSSHILLALIDGGYEKGLRVASAPVPEPSDFVVLSLAVLGVTSRCRRRET